MNRREFCEFIAAVASSGLLGAAFNGAALAASPLDGEASWATNANYPNNRAPLGRSRYVKLPLGAVRPTGWLLDQLNLQARGITRDLPELWDIAGQSGWKGDTGKNVRDGVFDTNARFVPRWLEGLTMLAGVLHDDELKAVGKPYMDHALSVKDLTSVTPSVIAWSWLARVMPEYHELTGDQRAIQIVRRFLDYADSVREPENLAVFSSKWSGALLSSGIWYYNQTGDVDVLALLQRCTKRCIDDFVNYFRNFPKDPKAFAEMCVFVPHYCDAKGKAGEPAYEGPTPIGRHGFTAVMALNFPAFHSLISGDRSERESVVQGMANLDQAYGQVGGRWGADGWFVSTDPIVGTETCAVGQSFFSLENILAVMGNVEVADRIEQLMFNAFPGACTADMWARQFYQQSNQVLVSVAKRPWNSPGTDAANIYGFKPCYPGPLADIHAPWPRYVASMWMATEDNGLAAMSYGPCRINAKVGNGVPIELIVETDYPFSDQVRVTVRCKESVRFPLHFRIPTWSSQAEVSVPGKATPWRPQSGSILKVEREWRDGDAVTLNFNFKVRTETRHNNAVAVAWGPLYFVLRIGEAFEKILALTAYRTDEPPVSAPPGCVDWHIAPTTDWNYALSIDRNNPQCEMIFNKISAMPFAQKGEPVRAPSSTEYLPWQHDVPMLLKMKAKLVPQWGMNGANAAPVPMSPVKTNQPETVVELIPYGCSRLRIAEFPTI
ncbi:glycoside hydrolase family 127 protein [Bradyrhizobium brasilense]|uniref:beta-L-arabinofuranosidase domain-containing protein n=1 Tax=Bradyrhizobium brasilense TaxID=1419277 RepID=UPI0024B25C0F|nr:beta-L-arabinofuranosidase domain-containing protein [Bradyrhizobium australafricanum]WFU33679.1 glycoside hydrolase family 127 protein [Bradyrhizobium australafricanum]